jgi:hypothetical protein
MAPMLLSIAARTLGSDTKDAGPPTSMCMEPVTEISFLSETLTAGGPLLVAMMIPIPVLLPADAVTVEVRLVLWEQV